MKKSIVSLIVLGAATGATAQGLHENVNVEGIYRPEIVEAHRFNTFPEHKVQRIPVTPLDFDYRATTAAFNPEARALGIIGWRTSREESARGYVDLSLGSWLNSSLSAGYTAVRTADTRLDVSLQHNSTSLWKPFGDELRQSHRRYRYDESLATRFCHNFSGIGLLEAQLQYRLGLFNYYSYLPSYTPPLRPEASPFTYGVGEPSQTLNDVAFRTGFTSTGEGAGKWNAALNVRHFGMRALYLPSGYDLRSSKATRETLLGASGGYDLKWEGGSHIGINATLDALLYSHPEERPGIEAPDNYGMLTLTPYYSFTRNDFIISIGANIDLSFGAPGKDKESHYSFFHISPDVKVDWKAGAMGLYLRLGGGSMLQTLASRFDRFYYTMPALADAQPMYTPLDARLGLQFGPFSGFSAGFEAAFRTSRHVAYQGWYPALLDNGTSAYGFNIPSDATPLYSLASSGRNLHGWKASINAAWEGSAVRIEARGSYMPQNSSTGWTDGLDRARWELYAALRIKPLKPLAITLDYDYRGVRSLDLPWRRNTSGGNDITIIDGKRYGDTQVRLPDLCMLGADATWSFSDKLSIGVRGGNLLNQRNDFLPCLPMQGIDIQGHLTFKF